MPIGVLNAAMLKMCSVYQIPRSWVESIITVESGWNPYAIRFEANYQWLYTPQKFLNHNNSYATEMTAQKFSWGLGQIMGALAREQGHTGLLTELLNPELNVKHICIRLEKLRSISQDPLTVFAMYNGGPGARKKLEGKFVNQAYVDKVSEELKDRV